MGCIGRELISCRTSDVWSERQVCWSGWFGNRPFVMGDQARSGRAVITNWTSSATDLTFIFSNRLLRRFSTVRTLTFKCMATALFGSPLIISLRTSSSLGVKESMFFEMFLVLYSELAMTRSSLNVSRIASHSAASVNGFSSRVIAPPRIARTVRSVSA